MVAKAALPTRLADTLARRALAQIIADLVEHLLARSVCFDLPPDFEELSQFILVFDQVKAAAHGNLEVAQPNLHEAVGVEVGVAAGREA